MDFSSGGLAFNLYQNLICQRELLRRRTEEVETKPCGLITTPTSTS
jgi:hypothetical protein